MPSKALGSSRSSDMVNMFLILAGVVLTTALTTAFTFVVVQGRVDNLYDRLEDKMDWHHDNSPVSTTVYEVAPAAPATTTVVPVPASSGAPAESHADAHITVTTECPPAAVAASPTYPAGVTAVPGVAGANPCEGKKPKHSGPPDNYFDNQPCSVDDIAQTLEQSGTNVTVGYKGEMDAGDRVPILTSYKEAGLCPVNVHWHLGTEHLSVGEYDEHGKGPGDAHRHRRSLRADYAEKRKGFQCMYYDDHDKKFTTPYDWKYCTDMVVGETYEVHWPHSAAGDCALSGTVTPWQYQTPFYDGVFCNDGVISLAPLNTYVKIGVQAQIFTIVNDESYYVPDLFLGMMVGAEKGTDIGYYTGSTTGTTRSNEVCSRYTPITWQVDRKCHMVSASSFDKMCQDMLAQADDMSGDVHPHGSRELVADRYAADNHVKRK